MFALRSFGFPFNFESVLLFVFPFRLIKYSIYEREKKLLSLMVFFDDITRSSLAPTQHNFYYIKVNACHASQRTTKKTYQNVDVEKNVEQTFRIVTSGHPFNRNYLQILLLLIISFRNNGASSGNASSNKIK